MMRLALALIGLAVAASLAALLANVPGHVTINVAALTITTSLAGLLGAMATLLLSVLALFWVGQQLAQMPHKLKALRQAQKREDGEAALAEALMALARGDARAAEQATALARQKLPDRALPLLMSAQAALLDAKPQAAEEDYRAMLGAAATGAQRVLGLQGLFYLAQRQGDWEAAGTHALRVLEMAPKTLWALDGLMALAVRINDFSAAHDWLRRWGRAGMKRAAVKRRRAVLLLAEAQMLMGDAAPDAQTAALDKAQQAARLEPHFMPAVALTARLQATHGQAVKARRLLRAAWAKTPHRELADSWLLCARDQPAAGLMRAAAHFIGKQKAHDESHLLRARIALQTQRWALARTLLEPMADSESATRQVFALLAEAAQGEGDEAAAAQWRDKARQAAPEAGWMAAGLRLGDWQALCPLTGQLDAVMWQTPEAAPHAAAAHIMSDGTQDGQVVQALTH